jgi:hypothetical protein
MGNDPLLSVFDTLAPLAAVGHAQSSAAGAFPELTLGDGQTAEFAGGGDAAALAAKTTDKGYRALVRCINVTTYSVIERLAACPRAYALDKIKAARELAGGVPEAKNIDFVYGHSVGAGVQGLLATNNRLEGGLVAAFLGWKANYDFGTSELLAKKKKTFISAQVAVERFHHLLQTHEVLSMYELLTVHLRGEPTPAVELSFKLDAENGYQHYGHIDAIVRNKLTGKIAVMEFKTTGYTSVDAALYANSNQALGYAVALDTIAPGVVEYDVIYCIYSPKSGEWTVMEFHKTLKKKAEWVQDLLLTHQQISVYRQLNHYPKRGSACMQYNRRCEWFGECDFFPKAAMLAVPEAAKDESVEHVDFSFSLSDVIAGQQTK